MIPHDQLPNDPRHQRFCDLILAGVAPGEAYSRCYPRSAKKSRSSAAAALKRRPDVKAYLKAIQAAAATASMLSVREKREYLARAVRTPRSQIDPDKDLNSDLVVSWSRSESEKGNSLSIKTVDPVAAIARDNELANIGDPNAAITNLAAAFASLGNTP